MYRGSPFSTGGPLLVRFLGPGKNHTMQNLYQWVLHSQFPLLQILLHSNSTCMNFSNKSENQWKSYQWKLYQWKPYQQGIPCLQDLQKKWPTLFNSLASLAPACSQFCSSLLYIGDSISSCSNLTKRPAGESSSQCILIKVAVIQVQFS